MEHNFIIKNKDFKQTAWKSYNFQLRQCLLIIIIIINYKVIIKNNIPK